MLFSVVVNVLLTLIKITAGIIGHSYALIADGLESASDVASSLVIWGGLKMASKPPDRDHPYGHGKIEPLVSALVSLILLWTAIFIIYQSVRNILHPHRSPEPFTLIIILVVIIIKEVTYRIVVKGGTEIESLAVKSDAWHHRSDALTSFAALIGISIALIGGPLYAPADAWAALFASAIIIFNALHLLKPALHELTDTAPSVELDRQVRALAEQVPGVVRVEKCFVRKMGFEYYVDLHIEVEETLSVRQGHDISHKVKDRIKEARARVYDVLIHIEPAEN